MHFIVHHKLWLAPAILFLAVGIALAGVKTATGTVASLQLVDSSQLGGGKVLIATFEDGSSFQFPGAEKIAAGSGVRLEVRYLPARESDVPSQACSARVLAISIERDGREVIKEAERPFEIYRNSDPECRD